MTRKSAIDSIEVHEITHTPLSAASCIFAFIVNAEAPLLQTMRMAQLLLSLEHRSKVINNG